MLDQAAQLRALADTISHDVVTKTMPISQEEQQKPSAVEQGQLIAITSGKGGVGKTNVVVNVALHLARLRKKVAIVDLDLGLANIDIILNITPTYNIEDVIHGRKAIDEIIVEARTRVDVIAGASGLPSLADLNDTERENFINALTHLKENYDYVLLDTAAGIAKNVVEFVLICDESIVVTTPEPTAITDAYAMIKVLHARNKDQHIHVLFNMVKTNAEADRYFKRVNTVIKQFLKANVNYIGCVHLDSCVRTAIMKRQPFSVIYPYSNAARSVTLVARNIVKNTLRLKSAQKGPGLLARFSELFGVK